MRKPQDAIRQLEQVVHSEDDPLTKADARVSLAGRYILHGQYASALEQCDLAKSLLSPFEFGPVHAELELHRTDAVDGLYVNRLSPAPADLSCDRALEMLPFFVQDARWGCAIDVLRVVAVGLRDQGNLDRLLLYSVLQLGAIHLARWFHGHIVLSRTEMLYAARCYEWSERFGRYVVWLGDQPWRGTSAYTTVPAGEIIGDICLLRGDFKEAEAQYTAALEQSKLASKEFNPHPYRDSVQRLPQKLSDLHARSPSYDSPRPSSLGEALSGQPASLIPKQAESLNVDALIKVRDSLLLSERWEEAARAACLAAERRLAQSDLANARGDVAMAVGAAELAFDARRSAAMMAALARAELIAGNAWSAVERFQSAIARVDRACYPGYEHAYVQYEEGFGDAMFAAGEHDEAAKSYQRALDESVRLHEPEVSQEQLRQKLSRVREMLTA